MSTASAILWSLQLDGDIKDTGSLVPELVERCERRGFTFRNSQVISSALWTLEQQGKVARIREGSKIVGLKLNPTAELPEKNPLAGTALALVKESSNLAGDNVELTDEMLAMPLRKRMKLSILLAESVQEDLDRYRSGVAENF